MAVHTNASQLLRLLLLASLIAVAIISYVAAIPMNWFRPAEVTGTIIPSPAGIWIVDDDGPAHFRKIQEAINAANPRDTILVRNGTYYENVDVNKTLALVGEEKTVTVIDGNGITPGTVVTVTANNVIVSNFTVQNSGDSPEDAGIRLDGSEGSIIINNIMRNNVRSIDLVDSVSNDISSNTISDAGYSGVALRYSHNNTIIDNLIVSNVLQIHSFQLWESNSNTLSSNIVYGSGTDYGISLQTNSNHNNIDVNLFLSNDVGINLGSNSNHNKISGNNITLGNRYGIVAGAGGNVIYHNNFIDNARQVWTDSINIWDDGYPSGGNYWSDYIGVDLFSGPYQNVTDSDGVGDTPYLIDDDNRDQYPLMKPWSWLYYHDIQVMDVTSSANEAYPGWKLNVTVTIKNNGDFAENFNLAVNALNVSKKISISLLPGANTTLTLTWGITNALFYVDYLIWAGASVVPDEINTVNNIFIDGIVRIKMVGDVNGDNKIDIRDIATAALSFGSYLTHPRWNMQADIYQDNKVDIRDLVLIAKNFGKTYP